MAKKFLTPIQSTVATGTAPLVVASTTGIANLNADLLDGQHGSFYAPIASPTFTGTPLAPTATAGTNTTQVATTDFVQNAVKTVVIDTKTASYTLILTDAGETLEMNVGTANDLTIPLNSSVAFPIGTTIDVIQYGSGQTTIVPTGGVTLRSKGNALKLTGQYSGATMYKRGTNEWVIVGDLTA